VFRILSPGLAVACGWVIALTAVPTRAGAQTAVETQPGAPHPWTALVVVGFEAHPQLDARDAWIPLAIEETLAWRLRRVPGMTVMPTYRAHQARRELLETDTDPPVPWTRVLRALGARRWLRGSCAGAPTALVLDLELVSLEEPDTALARVRLGPGRLFEMLDEATRWSLSQQRVARLSQADEALVFSVPASSPTVLEYYVKALAAARRDELRDAEYYAVRAADHDPGCLPALLLSAKVGLRAAPGARARAALHLRRGHDLAAARHDAFTLVEVEIAQGLLLQLERSFEAAQQRLDAALATAFALDDPYGQLDAISALCDLWLNYEPPARVELPPQALERLGAQKLRRAAEWLELALALQEQLDDRLAEIPTASKLAMVYDRLGSSEDALRMHQRALAAAERTGSLRNQVTGWLMLGQWYARQQRWQEALASTSRCLALAPENARPTVRLTLADIYRGLALPREALAQYEAACDALATGQDLLTLYRCLRACVELHMELGEREPAIRRLTEALDVARALGLDDADHLQQQLDAWQKASP